jgi:hypothetical protein
MGMSRKQGAQWGKRHALPPGETRRKKRKVISSPEPAQMRHATSARARKWARKGEKKMEQARKAVKPS